MAQEVRSRSGCRSCKVRRIKCGEEKPKCANCIKRGIEKCDYSLVLQWKSQKVDKKSPRGHCRFGQLEKCSRLAAYPRDDQQNYSFLNIETIVQHKSFLAPHLPSGLIYHFIKETTRLFSVAPLDVFVENPFLRIFPRLALQNRVVMNAVHTFSTIQMENLRHLNEFGNPRKTVKTTDILRRSLSRTLSDLLPSIAATPNSDNDEALGAILILAAADICFSNVTESWRTHLRGARQLLNQKATTHRLGYVQSNFKVVFESWLSYMEVIGSLSSRTCVTTIEELSRISVYLKNWHIRESQEKRRRKFEDIEYSTGMDNMVLSYLAEVAMFIQYCSASSLKISDVLHDVLNLEHAMVKHLTVTEEERDKICSTSPNSNNLLYDTLRTTNTIFTLTGVLQLKRRVLGLPAHSPVIKDLLRKICRLTQERIRYGSNAESCLIFSLFVCGCDLIDRDLYIYHETYLKHMDELISRGISSAVHGKFIMEQCWCLSKSWWDIMEEMNLDIPFAI